METTDSEVPVGYEGDSVAEAETLLGAALDVDGKLEPDYVRGISIHASAEVNGEARTLIRKVSPNDSQPDKDARIETVILDTLAWMDEVSAVS